MDYSRPYTIAESGAALAEAESVEITINSNDKPVRTLLKGLAGFSDGAEDVGLTIRSALPRTGFERDFGAWAIAHRNVEFAVREANKISTFKGRILTVTSASTVDAPNAVNVTFQGRLLASLTV